MDFAYAVHTEVGHRCIGARVNGRLVALERKLENGKSSRFSPRRRPTPGRRVTGSSSWRRRGPRPRSANGSPRSAARRRWRPARKRWPGKCAAADFRCSAW
ncbi:TGS domain protein [Mycobacterium xenopi 4042]|uniref:TGS domain protein n=1 Tax=Mycobacterium xenopi 4042 TaxID=1299334 RepID=X8AP84_MYCXE|nr:TGS domain protein [Mycobacterium xenopi 4042]